MRKLFSPGLRNTVWPVYDRPNKETPTLFSKTRAVKVVYGFTIVEKTFHSHLAKLFVQPKL